jgi:tetratricopeptide (TPR) repeat protein
VTSVVVIALAAVTHVQARNWSDSYALWRAAIRSFPTNQLAWQNLTSAYYLDGDVAQAAEIALRGLAVAPDDHDAAVNAISLLTTTQRLPEAERLLERALKSRPDSAELMLHAGLVAQRRGRLPEAVAALRRAAELRPGWAQPYLDLTYALEREGDLNAAVTSAAQAVTLDPRSQYSHRRLLELLLKSGQWDKALAAAERMTAQCPYSVDGWEMRIFILEQAGRSEDAEDVRRAARSRVTLPEGK